MAARPGLERVRWDSAAAARLALLVAVLVAGLWLRTLEPLNLGAAAWPWAGAPTATLYFSHGGFLFPLSRRLPADGDLPRAALEALMAGPPAGSPLQNPLPPGVALRSVRVEGGTAHVDLSAPVDALQAAPLGLTAIVATMTRLPDISSVALTADGVPLAPPAARAPLLYYPSSNGLVAVPTTHASPRAALDAFLSGPPSSELAGLPPDVRLLAYDTGADGRLSLEFSYTPSIRTLALERPDRMRFLLLGLIASLTEFPEVRAVRLDFGGQTRLGLGECSDLLRTPQARPALLNDERLLDW